MMTILALVLLRFAIRGFSETDSGEAVAGTSSDRTSSTRATDADATGSILDVGQDDAAITESPSETDAQTQDLEKTTEDSAVADETFEAVGSTRKVCKKAVGARDAMAVGSLPDTFTEETQTCARRTEALSVVVAIGTEVDADPDEHYKRWRMMAGMAQGDMGPYEPSRPSTRNPPAPPPEASCVSSQSASTRTQRIRKEGPAARATGSSI